MSLRRAMPLAWALPTITALVACGAPPAEPAVPVPPAPVADAPKAPCPDKDACYAAGKAAKKSNDEAAAKTLWAAGCELGSGDACVELGALVAGEPERAVELHLKGCKLGKSAGCFNAAEKRRKGDRAREASALYLTACKSEEGDALLRGLACSRGARAAYEARDFEGAAVLAGLGCSDPLASACDTLGVLHGNGEGVPKDTAKAATLFEKGCKAGDDEACRHQKQILAAADPLAVPGANLRMQSITAEGFTMSDFACRLDGGGLQMLVAGPVLAAVLGKKKAALRACAPKGAEVTVRWRIAGGRVVEAEAKASDPKVEACVARAVKSSVATFDATCRASFTLGGRAP